MEKKHRIIIDPAGDFVYASHGQNLLTALLKNKVKISNSCGGSGTCGTCRVQVIGEVSGLSERTDIEIEMAKERGFVPSERLSCQCSVFGPVEIQIPNQSI
ncbi:MAG: hypothetical protein BroJett040_08650 [Oligoflexia bacterium]|nr:MAG: hypothetical protein BroJett040_08650 [Oligoflexia bacterium]